MTTTHGTLTQTTYEDAQRELEERFEAWCALTNTDPNHVGAWETFEAQLPCD